MLRIIDIHTVIIYGCCWPVATDIFKTPEDSRVMPENSRAEPTPSTDILALDDGIRYRDECNADIAVTILQQTGGHVAYYYKGCICHAFLLHITPVNPYPFLFIPQP